MNKPLPSRRLRRHLRLRGFKMNPPGETNDAVAKPVRVPGKGFDEAMDALLSKRPKRRKRG